jgi:WD40 repeat protein
MSKYIIAGLFLLYWASVGIPCFAETKNSWRICFVRGDQIFVREPDGRTSFVVKGQTPSLSPDGRIIAFTSVKGTRRSESQVNLIDIETGRIFQPSGLKRYHSFRPIWSPDGRKLAVQVVGDDKAAFAIVDPFSEDLVLLAMPEVEYFNLSSWTADGKSIVVNTLDHVYQIALDGKVLRQLAFKDLFGSLLMSSESQFSFSRNGKLLLFSTSMVPEDVGVPGIYLYDLDNKRLVRITSDRLGGLYPQWRFSENEIMFTGFIKGKYKPGTVIPYFNIYLTSLAVKKPQLLIRNAEEASYAVTTRKSNSRSQPSHR